MGKVWRRILVFGFLLLLFAQIDKTNIAFAALTMRRDLGLTATMFGFCVSIFFVGYILCEIPSNLIMARVGARTWLARISITLGLASVATMFAVGPRSLLTIRFLLGMAEAGMIPGLLLYFTYWFPPAYRARANGWFLVAMPVAGVVGAVLSGAILDLNGTFGLAGWQWLFLLLGMAPVTLGVVAFFVLTSVGPKYRSTVPSALLTISSRDERSG
jgi:ACS family 4-hydroxyphenylacetate permease-like MFS transporter